MVEALDQNWKYQRFSLIIILIIGLTMNFSSCESDVCTLCSSQTNQTDHIAIMDVCNAIKESPNKPCKECITFLLTGIVDLRVSTGLKYNGSSVYVQKVLALQKISGIDANASIRSRPNAETIDLYLKWAQSNYELDISDICLVSENLRGKELGGIIENLDLVEWPNQQLSCK